MRSPQWRGGWVAAAVIAVLASGWWWLSLPPRPVAPVPPSVVPPSPSTVTPPAVSASPEAPIPSIKIEGSRLAGVDAAGRRQWELRAASLKVDSVKGVVTLVDVVGQLYRQGVPTLAFAAPRGIFVLTTKDVQLSGGVRGRTADGKTLQAAVVRWDGRKQRLVASGGVTVAQPGMMIRADRMISDAGLRETTFAGNITVNVRE